VAQGGANGVVRSRPAGGRRARIWYHQRSTPVTLADLFNVLRRFWPLVLGVLAATLLLALLVLYVPKERFESTSSVVVQPSSGQSLSFGATEAVQYLLPPIVKRARSDAFRVAIRHRVRAPRGTPVDIGVENDAGTAIVQLTVTSTKASLARLGASWASLELIRRPLSNYVIVTALEPASPPESTRSQRAAPVLFGAGVLGVILGLFAAIAASMLRRRIPTGQDAASAHGLELLGEIPRVSRLPARARDVFTHEQVDARAAFERLAGAIPTADGRPQTIAVTSWVDGEGKTTVTANVAYALAAFGYQVTAVDFDLRHPTLHEALGVALSPGVSDYVGRFAATVQHTDLPNLDVIAGGAADEHPVKVLRWAMGAVREVAGDRLLVIDTPPLFTPEAAIAATRVDAVVLVVDARKREPRDLEQALDELRRAGANVLGLVFNNARIRRGRRVPYAYYNPRRASAPPTEDHVPDAALEPQRADDAEVV
jgi:capsular exopolysaccharide synthesis family protein